MSCPETLSHSFAEKNVTGSLQMGDTGRFMVTPRVARLSGSVYGRASKSGRNCMYKPFDLTGKVALVTGGNGGIGFGMAEALAQAGADVVVWGTKDDKNAAAVAKLKAHGVRAGARKVNVASETEV